MMMGRVCGRQTRYFFTGIGLVIAISSALTSTAQARWRHHRHHYYRQSHYPHETYSPAFSAMVVDANTGKTLYATAENELRHPASITKVMTLYLLFEQLEKNRIDLDSRLEVSAHAARQAPSKIGLEPGDTIQVEDAIKAIVTKSANDVAVSIAEKIGGNEDTFAEMMTRKAHALGMSRTIYRNASGLPDDEQVTTARDLTILGRAIQERFPGYYKYFSTRTFYYAGGAHRNHNHLLGRIEGMDGIKTGYTRASGFNLLTSVKRDGHRIVSVVLGGRSAGARDRIMAGLIEDTIDRASTNRTVSMIAEGSDVQERGGTEKTRVASSDPLSSPPPNLIAPNLAVPALPPRARIDAKIEAPQAVATRSPESAAPAAAAIALPQKPRPAFVSGAPKLVAAGERTSNSSAGSDRKRAILDGSTSSRPLVANTSSPAPLTATPSALHGAAPSRSQSKIAEGKSLDSKAGDVRPAAVVRPLLLRPNLEMTPVAKPEPDPRQRPGHTGWMIQIGATDEPGKANELLARARTQAHAGLGSAQAFTEKVQKGETTLYRARFAGLDPDSAEAACRSLKRSGFACFATRN